jgi:hypothetical protein
MGGSVTAWLSMIEVCQPIGKNWRTPSIVEFFERLNTEVNSRTTLDQAHLVSAHPTNPQSDEPEQHRRYCCNPSS